MPVLHMLSKSLTFTLFSLKTNYQYLKYKENGCYISRNQ